MSRTRTTLAAIASVLTLGVAIAPAAQAQPLPGGSVELPPLAPFAVPVPAGSTSNQLPDLPYPLFWNDPVAPARYTASNWVIPFSYCPARNQRAFAEDGTQLWCTQLERTDAKLWAPYTTLVPYPAPALAPGLPTRTEVANSLAAKPCEDIGTTSIDPSNGQEAYCDINWVDFGYAVWQYQPGS
ncbi:hypothetical protein ACWIE7_13760 [Dietzia sp. NPDC055343]